jgi:hypothetical protein
MKYDIKLYLYFLWTFILGITLYERLPFKSIVIFCGLFITFVIIRDFEKQKLERYRSHDNQLNNVPKNVLNWLTTMIQARDDGDDDEKERCYFEIMDTLKSQTLLKNGHPDHKYHQKIIPVLQQFKPIHPVPHNISSEPNFGISVGYT